MSLAPLASGSGLLWQGRRDEAAFPDAYAKPGPMKGVAG